MRLVDICDGGADLGSLGLVGALPTLSGRSFKASDRGKESSGSFGESMLGLRATTGTWEKCSVGILIWKEKRM